MLPSVRPTTSAPETFKLSRLNGWPMRSPTDASTEPSRMPPHGSGPMWFATPSSRRTFTPYSLPVSTGAPVCLISAPTGTSANRSLWPVRRVVGERPLLARSGRPESTSSGHSGSQPGTTRLGKTNDAGAARREERIAVGELKLRQSLPPGGLRFDLAGLRQSASRACASAISGISGVDAKPSSAGARTASASAGRAVDR